MSFLQPSMSPKINTEPLEESLRRISTNIHQAYPVLMLLNKIASPTEINSLVKSKEYVKFIQLQKNVTTEEERYNILAHNIIIQELTDTWGFILEKHKNVFKEKITNKEKVFKYIAMTYYELIEAFPTLKLNKIDTDQTDQKWTIEFIDSLESFIDTSKIATFDELQKECVSLFWKYMHNVDAFNKTYCNDDNNITTMLTYFNKSFEVENINKKRKL
jgi:hypothetical protein